MAFGSVVIVGLALLQALILAALPMVNQWRPEIEVMLSERFRATVTVSEIGAKASWAGPYLEALNLVVDRPEGRLEVRRVQMLINVPQSVFSGELIVDQLVLDEGELVSHQSGGGALPDPTIWVGLMAQLQRQLTPLGAIKLYNFDVLAGAFSAKRLSLEVNPARGVIARTRLVSEDLSLPIELDWRYPADNEVGHELRLRTTATGFPIPWQGYADMDRELDLALWLVLRESAPVTGQFQMDARSESPIPINASLTGRLELESATQARFAIDLGRANLPGVVLSADGAAVSWSDNLLSAQIPALAINGLDLHQALKPIDPDPKLTRLLTGNQPSFDLSNVALQWSPSQLPVLQARVDRFDIQAFGGIPQIGPVSGEIHAEGMRGVFDFESASGDFALPDIFPVPWQSQRLSGALAFDRSEQGLVVRGENLLVADAHQHVVGSLRLDLPREGEQSMHVELLADANERALPSLLPIDLETDISEFLLRGIESVAVRGGRISYSGPLGANIDRNRRELSMYFPMATYRLRPLEQWPAFSGADGQVRFSGKRARVQLTSAEFGGLTVRDVDVRQTDADAGLLSIRGALSGDAETALRVLDGAGIKPDALGRDVIFDGRLTGQVDLLAPVEGAAPRGIVAIETEDLTVGITGLNEPITGLVGRAEYNLESGFRASSLSGALLGDAITLDVVADDDGVEVQAAGRLATQNVSQLVGLGFSEALLSGVADWTAKIQQQSGLLQVLLQTDGVGIESQLPFPLTKSAATPGAILVELNQAGDAQQMTAQIFADTEVSARLDQRPLALSVVTPEIDLLDWAQLPGDADQDTTVSLLLNLERVRVGETSLKVDQAAVNLRPDSLEVSFAGEELAGRVQRLGEAPVAINLERLILAPASDFLAPPGDDPLVGFDPGSLPSARIQVSDLRRGEKRYQDLELVVVSGASRLDVTRLAFTRDGQRFFGELAWIGAAEGGETALVLRADGPALGGFLRVNESEPLLEAKAGQFSADLAWSGSPLAFSMLTATGQFQLQLENGRFFDLGNSAEVLRLFGILNIDTLTRRLRLDFLDLVQPGVAFDRVSARGQLDAAVLTLDPELVMQGPSAGFRLTGNANLRSQTLDQTLEVDIPLTNNLPLASVLLGAPQIGGAIYLVEKALGTKIIKVGKTDYRIEGSFDDPNVKLIPPFSNKQKDEPNVDAVTDDQ